MRQVFFKSVRDKAFRTLENDRPNTWTHFDNLTKENLEDLCNSTKLDIEDIQDALDLYEIPRIEKERGHIILFVRAPAIRSENLHTQTLTLILTKSELISLCPRTSSLIPQILQKNPPIPTSQRSKLLFYLLLQIAQSFHKKIKGVQNDVLKTKANLEHVDAKDILALTKSEEILNQYQASLVPFRGVLERLSSGKVIKLSEDDGDLLEDLLVAIRQSIETCGVSLKSIVSMRNSYQMIFNNSLNKTTKVLTCLAVIFMIPTLLAGLYGMNVKLPFAESPGAFIGILAFGLFLSLIAVVLFYWRKWI